MTHRKAIPETELAEAVVLWLKAEGWEVYQEIETTQGGPRADIVGVKDGIVWIIEVKRNITIELIGQASRWKYHCHRISVAVLSHQTVRRHGMNDIGGARREGLRLVYRIMEEEGMGLLKIDRGYKRWEVSTFGGFKPKHRDDAPDAANLLAGLTPHHKDFAKAGNAIGKRLTQFGLTAIRVREFVQAYPGSAIKEVVDGIEGHHYASDEGAVQGIRSAAKDRLIEGIRIDVREKPHRLYPAEVSPARAGTRYTGPEAAERR